MTVEAARPSRVERRFGEYGGRYVPETLIPALDELEREWRGVYGGGVGYFSAGGDMDVCIALRTGVIKDDRLYVQAGGGVVHDSDPGAEFQETVSKSRARVQAARDAGLFAAGRGGGN